MSKKNTQPREEIAAPVVLVILDGFGLAPEKNQGNAITPATAPNIFGYMDKYPSTELVAHGKDVGLFPLQEGNSEAGHFNIGAGRLVEQDIVRISHAIKDGTFFKNEAFHQAVFHAKKYKSAVHVMGLLTDNESAHAIPEHLYALLEYLRRESQEKVFLHLFTDGRDSSPHSAMSYLRELRTQMVGQEKIATVMGRFYAMDRNKIWERTESAYNAMVLSEGYKAESAEAAIEQGYNRNETDEYISPTVIFENEKPVGVIENHDVIFFFNARSDRARQITKAFVQPDFETRNIGSFKRKKVFSDSRFVAMTDFGPDLPGIFTAFPSPDIDNAMAKAIGESRRQLYISETEKYAHVTFFLNGGYPEPINGEDRELIKSEKQYSYADKPEMCAHEIVDRVIGYLKSDRYNFICINFPNADMVGHTGDLAATCTAVRVVDEAVKNIADVVLSKKGSVVITADHGNAEEMINRETGEMDTEHSVNPVPFIWVGGNHSIVLRKGSLRDVAPTLLKIMSIKQPKEMTGKALF